MTDGMAEGLTEGSMDGGMLQSTGGEQKETQGRRLPHAGHC